jgi:hypothetical protein
VSFLCLKPIKGSKNCLLRSFGRKAKLDTPSCRRWLAFCNPELSALITDTLGSDEWTLDLNKLRGLEKFASDAEFQKKWRAVKMLKKQKLAAKIKELTGDDVNLGAMFDVHVRACVLLPASLMVPNVLTMEARFRSFPLPL